MRKSMFGLAVAVLILALQVSSRGGEQDAKDLVTKAIKASGGEAKVAPLKAGTCKAKANIQQAARSSTPRSTSLGTVGNNIV